MGWTFTEKPKDVKRWFEDSLTWETETNTNRCLRSSIRLNEAYAAVETIDKETGEKTVWAAIYLLQYTRAKDYNFGYKEMDETCGPYACNCPTAILDLLTPSFNEYNEYAKNWRQKCRDNIKNRTRKIEVGRTYLLRNCRIPHVTITEKVKNRIFGSYLGLLYPIPRRYIGEELQEKKL